MIPTYFAALVLLSGVFAKSDAHLRWLMFWALFGASAAFQLPALGGASIAPAVAFLPFLVLASLREQGVSKWMRLCRDGQPGFWLLLAVLWGVVGAIFLPRLFAGEIDVLTTDRLAAFGEPALRIAPLKPVSTNISQSAYAVGGLLVFLGVRSLCSMPRSFGAFSQGVIALAVVNVVCALINIAELYLGMPSVMDLVRNGGYAILNQSTLAGVQRIHGTFAEASSFAGFTLPLFAFVFSLWRSGVRTPLTGGLAAVLLALLLISTSSTGYAGLLLYGGSVALLVGWRVLTGQSDRTVGSLLGIAALLVALLAVIGIVRPGLFAPVQYFFEITLFGKLQSESGLERGSWNLHAWTNFLDTHGLGAGLGSARASSLPLVLLSNLGVIGTGLFALFLLVVFVQPAAKPPVHYIEPVVHAARHALFASLLVACISATVFDLGVSFYAFAAVACGYQQERQPHGRRFSAVAA